MVKKLVLALALVPLVVGYAYAQNAPTHLFDDLNGDGISDGSVSNSDYDADVPTEESVDVDQPLDDTTSPSMDPLQNDPGSTLPTDPGSV